MAREMNDQRSDYKRDRFTRRRQKDGSVLRRFSKVGLEMKQPQQTVLLGDGQRKLKKKFATRDSIYVCFVPTLQGRAILTTVVEYVAEAYLKSAGYATCNRSAESGAVAFTSWCHYHHIGLTVLLHCAVVCAAAWQTFRNISGCHDFFK